MSLPPQGPLSTSTASSSALGTRSEKLQRGRQLLSQFQDRRRANSLGAIPREQRTQVGGHDSHYATPVHAIDSLVKLKERGLKVWSEHKSMSSLAGDSPSRWIFATPDPHGSMAASRPPNADDIPPPLAAAPQPEATRQPVNTEATGETAVSVPQEVIGELHATQRLLRISREENDHLLAELHSLRALYHSHRQAGSSSAGRSPPNAGVNGSGSPDIHLSPETPLPQTRSTVLSAGDPTCELDVSDNASLLPPQGQQQETAINSGASEAVERFERENAKLRDEVQALKEHLRSEQSGWEVDRISLENEVQYLTGESDRRSVEVQTLLQGNAELRQLMEQQSKESSEQIQSLQSVAQSSVDRIGALAAELTNLQQQNASNLDLQEEIRTRETKIHDLERTVTLMREKSAATQGTTESQERLLQDWQRRLEEAESALASSRQQILSIEGLMQRKDAELLGSKSKLTQMEHSHAEAQAGCHRLGQECEGHVLQRNKLHSELEELRMAFAQLGQKDGLTEAELAHSRQQVVLLQRQLETMEIDRRETESRAASFSQEVQHLKAAREEDRITFEEVRNQLQSVLAQRQKQESQSYSAERELRETQAELDKCRGEIRRLTDSAVATDRQLTDSNEVTLALQRELAALREKEAAADLHLQQLSKERELATSQLDAARLELSLQQEENQLIRKELRDAESAAGVSLSEMQKELFSVRGEVVGLEAELVVVQERNLALSDRLNDFAVLEGESHSLRAQLVDKELRLEAEVAQKVQLNNELVHLRHLLNSASLKTEEETLDSVREQLQAANAKTLALEEELRLELRNLENQTSLTSIAELRLQSTTEQLEEAVAEIKQLRTASETKLNLSALHPNTESEAVDGTPSQPQTARLAGDTSQNTPRGLYREASPIRGGDSPRSVDGSVVSTQFELNLRQLLAQSERRSAQLAAELEVCQSQNQRLKEALDSNRSVISALDQSIQSDGRGHQLDREQIAQQADRLEELEQAIRELEDRYFHSEKERDRLAGDLVAVTARLEAKELALEQLDGERQGLRMQLGQAKQDLLKRAAVNSALQQDILDLQRANDTLDDTVSKCYADRASWMDMLQRAEQAQELADSKSDQSADELLMTLYSLIKATQGEAQESLGKWVAAKETVQKLQLKLVSQDTELTENHRSIDQLLELLKEHERAFVDQKVSTQATEIENDESYRRLELEKENITGRHLIGASVSRFWQFQLEHLRDSNSRQAREVADLRDSSTKARDQWRQVQTDLELTVQRLRSEQVRLVDELTSKTANAELKEQNLQDRLAELDKEFRVLTLDFESTAHALEKAQLEIEGKDKLIHSLEAQSQEKTHSMRQLEADVEHQRQDSARLRAELHQHHSSSTQRVQEIQQQMSSLEGTTKRLQSQVTDLEAENQNLKLERRQLQSKLADETDQKVRLESELREHQAEARSLRDRFSVQADEMTLRAEELSQQRNIAESLRTDLALARQETRDAANQLHSTHKELESLRAQVHSLEQDAKSAKHKEQQSVERGHTLEMELQQRNHTLDSIRSELDSKEQTLIRVQEKYHSLKQSSEDTIVALKQKSSSMEAELETVRSQLLTTESVHLQKLRDAQSMAAAAQANSENRLMENKSLRAELDDAKSQLRNMSQELQQSEVDKENLWRQCRTLADEKDRLMSDVLLQKQTHEQVVTHLRSSLVEEHRSSLTTVERLLQSERQNVQDVRQSQQSALKFIDQLTKEKRQLEERMNELREELNQTKRQTLEQTVELTTLNDIAVQCAEVIGSDPHLKPSVLMKELVRRLIGQHLNGEETTFLEQVQCDELKLVLERHSAQSVAIGSAVHRVFANLRRALEALKRRKPNKETDVAAFNRYKLQKAALEHLEQQNMAVERCVRSATVFHSAARSHSDTLAQHVKTVENALSAAHGGMVPLAVAQSISQQKVYIGAKANTLLSHAAHQLSMLKEIRDAYAEWERDFSQTGMQLIGYAHAVRSASLNSGQVPTEIPVPVIVENLEAKIAVFADDEEFIRKPLVLPVESFREEQMRSASAGSESSRPFRAASTTEQGRPTRPGQRRPKPKSQLDASGADESGAVDTSRGEWDEELGVREDEAGEGEGLDRESPLSEEPDDSFWHEVQRRQVKTTHENQRLYRLVRTLNAKLKTESHKARALQNQLESEGLQPSVRVTPSESTAGNLAEQPSSRPGARDRESETPPAESVTTPTPRSRVDGGGAAEDEQDASPSEDGIVWVQE